MLKKSIAAAMLPLVAGCASVPVQPPPGPQTPLFEQTGQLPPITASSGIPFTATDAPAADARVKVIVGDGFRAQLTYGMGGGRQACGTLPACDLKSASMSGRSATYIRFPQTQTTDGVTYSHKLIGYLPVVQLRPDEPGSGLLLNGWCNEPDSCNRLEALFLSFRVEP